MSNFASLIVQTVSLFALVAAIASVWYSFRHLTKAVDELAAAARAQQSRLDTLAERVRVLESQRLTLADYRALRGDGTPGLKPHLGTDQMLVGSTSQMEYASPERLSGISLLDTYRSIRAEGPTGDVSADVFRRSTRQD